MNEAYKVKEIYWDMNYCYSEMYWDMNYCYLDMIEGIGLFHKKKYVFTREGPTALQKHTHNLVN